MIEFKRLEFDREDPNNIGRPSYFDPELYLFVVEQMITADEVERAMWMLDNMPAWFRKNKPQRAVEIKKRLLKQFFRPIDYAKNGESIADQETALMYQTQPHGQILLDLVKSLNYQSITPMIHEMAPGNYWVPTSLRAKNCIFNYYGPSLNEVLEKQISMHKVLDAMTQIFVCFETIEHLERDEAIYHHYVREAINANYILLSTPNGAFNGGMPEWYLNDLGHLRTYTPKEFGDFALKHWPEFSWKMYESHVMTLVGERK